MPTDKPLVLAEEIAKIVRDNDPAAWLVDAEAALAGLQKIERVKEQGFRVVRDDIDGRSQIELRTQRHVIGIYDLPSGQRGIRFRPHPKFAPRDQSTPECTLPTEQDFIRHLLFVAKSLCA
jgi:hypothetical protein